VQLPESEDDDSEPAEHVVKDAKQAIKDAKQATKDAKQATKDAKQAGDPSEKAFKHLAQRIVRNDFVALGLNSHDLVAIDDVVEDLLADVRKFWQPGEEYNSAADTYVPGEVRKSILGFEDDPAPAFQRSIGAVFPTARDASGRLSLYVPGNISLTVCWIHLGKHSWPPAWVEILARLGRGNDETEREEMLVLEDDISAVTLKTPYWKRVRLGQTTSAAEFAIVEYECKPGEPVSLPSRIVRKQKVYISENSGAIPVAPRKN